MKEDPKYDDIKKRRKPMSNCFECKYLEKKDDLQFDNGNDDCWRCSERGVSFHKGEENMMRTEYCSDLKPIDEEEEKVECLKCIYLSSWTHGIRESWICNQPWGMKNPVVLKECQVLNGHKHICKFYEPRIVPGLIAKEEVVEKTDDEKYYNIFDKKTKEFLRTIKCSPGSVQLIHPPITYQEVKEVPVYEYEDGWYLVDVPELHLTNLLRRKELNMTFNRAGDQEVVWSSYKVIAKLNDVEWLDDNEVV